MCVLQLRLINTIPPRAIFLLVFFPLVLQLVLFFCFRSYDFLILSRANLFCHVIKLYSVVAILGFSEMPVDAYAECSPKSLLEASALRIACLIGDGTLSFYCFDFLFMITSGFPLFFLVKFSYRVDLGSQ